MNKKAQLIIWLSGGLFLLVDRFLKFQSLHDWNQTHLINKYLGWQPFLNPGIGFGLPVPNWLIITLTLPILALIGCLLVINNKQSLPLTLVFIGAFSNFVDRIIYNHTVDYILTVTSLYNIADVMIVAGFVLYFISLKHENIKT